MKNVVRAGGGLIAAFAAVVTMTMTSSVSAVAATSAAANTAERAQPALPDGAPAGCHPGDFCSYNQGGGADLCLASPSNEPDMGYCANVDEAVFNNGYVETYDVVFMYWGYYYGGAYTCLTQGNYWLYTYSYKFNNPGSGYGQRIVHNVASFKWGTYDCGNWISD